MKLYASVVMLLLVMVPVLADSLPPDLAQPSERPEELLDPAALQQRFEGLESFDSAFRQTVYSSDGVELQDVHGHLSVTRRGEVRWTTEAPYEQLLVADGETIWLYDPDLEQVTVRPFRHNITETPAMLLIGDVSDISAEYRIFAVDETGEQESFQLVPKQGGGMFDRIELTFVRDLPARMALWDAMEQVTVIDFSDGRINISLEPDLFHFEAPPGVDVLYDD